MKRLYRVLQTLLTILIVIVAVCVVLAAVLGIESEVRGKNALEKLQLVVQGPDEGTPRQRYDAEQITACVAQMEPVPLDVEANFTAIEEQLAQAKEHKCDLLVLPELALTGLELDEQIWDLAEPIDGPVVKRLQKLAKRKRIALVTSVPELYLSDVFNTAVFIDRRGVVTTGRKLHPPFVERARYALGGGPQVLETSLGRFGVSLCADTFREQTFSTFMNEDVDAVLLLVSAPMHDRNIPGMRFLTEAEWAAVPGFYSDRLGVAVLAAHASGPVQLLIPFRPGTTIPAHYAGLSTITDRRAGQEINAEDPTKPTLLHGDILLGRRGRQTVVELQGDYIVQRPILFHLFTWYTELRSAAIYRDRPKDELF